MNEAFFNIANSQKNYQGKVSVVAHSLGTVVTYDILCQQLNKNPRLELGFTIDCYFILGSPLALFQSVYSTSDNYIRKELPRVKHFYNLYHPADLIAYRIEPLLKINKSD